MLGEEIMIFLETCEIDTSLGPSQKVSSVYLQNNGKLTDLYTDEGLQPFHCVVTVLRFYL